MLFLFSIPLLAAACTHSTPAGTFALGPLALRHTAKNGWLFAASACADISGASVAASCANAPPAPIFQVTPGACVRLGSLESRAVAPLAGALGVAVTFSGGDGGRRALLEATCSDGPTVVDGAEELRPLEYVLRVQSRVRPPARPPHFPFCSFAVLPSWGRCAALCWRMR